MISRELFAAYVRDALANFYDCAHLQIHPLTELLVLRGSPEETKAQALRQALTEAIEALRPEASIPFGRSEWLPYRVMRLRYMESLGQDEICRELGIGRTSCYRYHQEALEAVVSILWERYQRDAARQEQRAATLAPNELAREEAIKVTRAAPREPVSLLELLEGIKLIIRPLAEQQGIDLRIEAPPSLPVTYGDPAMLRQIVLTILTEAMGLVTGRTLRLSISARARETLWQLRPLDEAKVGRQDAQQTPRFAIGRSLLSVYEGRLWLEKEQGILTLSFTLPNARPWTILILDDDPETIELYRRYLPAREFAIQVARRGAELEALLTDARPDLILLDVLMPREDGWSILQRLKNTPETAPIPVVICSVLSQPSLALALGAAAVLQKPIDQASFLQTVRSFLPQEDSGGRARPAGRADTAPL